MNFRVALASDIPQIIAIERLPEFRSFVGSWSEDQHYGMLVDHDALYLVAEGQVREVTGFAILLGLQSEHKSLELKRIAVGKPNQGVGRRLLEVVAKKVFDEYQAHRLWLDVFETNTRARHLYETFGFRVEGTLREAVFRDGNYHSLVLMSLLDHEYRMR
jgi:RimJ/RimL family protein N-acetyltransferase